MNLETYKASGRFAPSLFIWALIIGGVGAYTGAWIYQFFCDLLPFLWLNIVFGFVFGYWLGAAAYMALKMGNSRSKPASFVVALLIAIAGVALSHHIARKNNTDEIRSVMMEELSESDLSGESEIDDATSAIDETLSQLEEAGWEEYLEARASVGYSFSRRGRETDVQDEFVYVLWGAELLFVIFLCLSFNRGESGKPFCELANDWCKEETLGSIHKIDPIWPQSMASSNSLRAFFEPMRKDASGFRAEYILYSSTNVMGESFLSIKMYQPDKDGKEEEGKAFVDFAKITPEEVESLKSILEVESDQPQEELGSNSVKKLGAKSKRPNQSPLEHPGAMHDEY